MQIWFFAPILMVIGTSVFAADDCDTVADHLDHITVAGQSVQIVPGTCKSDDHQEKKWAGCHVLMHKFSCKRQGGGVVGGMAIGNADDHRMNWKCHMAEDASGFTNSNGDPDYNKAKTCYEMVQAHVKDWSQYVYKAETGIPGVIHRQTAECSGAITATARNIEDINP